jgi:hypothetical protein
VKASSANNAISSDDRLVINGGTVQVESDDDGIKSEQDEDDTESEGVVEINGGTVTVKAGGDGIEAANDIIINGGNISINSGDDAIHADTNANIYGGTITIAASDDAIHAEYTLTIGEAGASGPSITANKCYEGLEGGVVNLVSGSATITASDDGINAANQELGNNYAFAVNISGGTWIVDAGGDALDSNRDINITGGKTELFGSLNSGNSALDYDGSCTLTGGSILAVGMSGMSQGVSSNNCLTFNNVSASNGTSIEIKDASGNTVYSSTAKKQANQVIFASAQLTSGNSYTLYLNGKSAGTATATTGNGGMMQGGGGRMNPWGQQAGGMSPWGQQTGQTGQQQTGQQGRMNSWGQDGQQQTRQTGQTGQQPDSQFPAQPGSQQPDSQQPAQPGSQQPDSQLPAQPGGQQPVTPPASSDSAPDLSGGNSGSEAATGQDADSLQKFVERLYENVLGRKSDTSGLASWIKALQDGHSATKVVRGFFNSTEFQNMDLSNGDYLTKLYLTLFNRTPDTAGYNAWLKYLNAGTDRSKILAGFTGSQEFANLCESFGVKV